jgi:hypothetical protein
MASVLNLALRLWHTERMAKRPRDPNQLAKMIVDIATGEMDDTVSESRKHPSPKRHAGLKGGKARATALSKKRRSAIAKKAANSRWHP